MSNLNIPSDVWLEEQFEFLYCEECGGDAGDHTPVPFMGNWFALCKNPLSEDLTPEEAEEELNDRRTRKDRSRK